MSHSVIFSQKYWYAILVLTQNTMLRQYRNTFLGNAWSLIQPFTHIVIISYFFGFLLRQSPEVMAGNLVSGLPLWNFLSISTVTAAGSLVSREGIIKKVIISRSLFPIADTLVQGYILCNSFIAMYAAFILFFPHQFTWLVIFVPIALIPLVITVFGISVAVAFSAPYIRDIPQLLSLLLNVAYWTVPIIYPYSMVPESKKIFFELNPLYCLIRPVQIIINEHSLPSLLIMLKAFLVSFLAVLIGYTVHKKLSKNVVFYL